MVSLKAGVIGLGVGEQHIAGFQEVGVEVVALCDMDSKKLAVAKDAYPECHFYSDAADLIGHVGLDVVAIASYDQDHAAQILQAIEANLHVFCEKPLCLTRPDLQAIRKAYMAKPTLKLSTNTILRLSPRFLELQDIVERGTLGEVYNIEMEYAYGRIEKLMSGWRGQIENYSVTLGGGIHMVDLMLWLMRDSINEVMAYGNKFCSTGSFFKTPDMVSALVKFENGAIGRLSANFGCVRPHFHNVTLYGTRATYVNDLPQARLFTDRNQAVCPKQLSSDYPGVHKGALIKSFINEIRGAGAAIVQPKQAFQAMEVCFAIEESLQTGKPVRLISH